MMMIMMTMIMMMISLWLSASNDENVSFHTAMTWYAISIQVYEIDQRIQSDDDNVAFFVVAAIVVVVVVSACDYDSYDYYFLVFVVVVVVYVPVRYVRHDAMKFYFHDRIIRIVMLFFHHHHHR
jgi:hypothetical protein